MAYREASAVTVAAVVAVAAILGGAFYPGPRLMVGVLMAAAIGSAFGAARIQLVAEEWMILGFVVWGAVAAFAAASAPLAARQVVTVWLVTWGLWVIARRAGGSASRMGLTVVSAAAVLLAFGVGFEAVGAATVRVGGLLENPNVTAALLVVSLPALLVVDGRKWWRLTAGAVILLGLFLTGSRAGLLAMLAAGAVFLPRGRARFFALLTGGVGGAAILVWRFAAQPDILAWFRPKIWMAVVRLWVAHPIAGVGPGGLVDAAGVERLLHADHVGQRQFLIAYAESSPLSVLVQTGLVGFFIAVVGLLLWWRTVRRRGGFSRPTAAVMVAVAVMGAFHDVLTVDVVLWWWALVIGFLEMHANPIADWDHRLMATSPQRITVGLVFSYVVLWGVVEPAWARWLWHSGELNSSRMSRTMAAEPWYEAPLEWRSRELISEHRWTWLTAAEALSVSARAVRIHPGAARLWAVDGMVRARVASEFGPWPDSIRGARNAFARAVELEPHQPWTLLEWARLERNLGNTHRAIELVTRALEEEPNTVRARLFLARLELDRGNTRAARAAYEAALQSTRLRARPDLNGYERELLSAPAWQFREVGEALR